MGVAIDRDLAGDINNPSFEVINFAIDQRKNDIPRLDRLFNYYNGKQPLKPDGNNLRVGAANGKEPNVMVNHAKYVTDMVVGFTTGNPISISAAKGKDIQPIDDALQRMDINKHDAEMEKDLSVFGEAYELVYLSKITEAETDERIEKIDPRGIVLVTDDTAEKNPLFGIHFQEKYDLKGNQNGFLITVYTEKYIIKYRTESGTNLSASNLKSPPKVKEHYFGDVPVIEYRNNEERQGDFEQSIKIMDAYNVLQSDRLADKENFVNALLVIYGFTVDEINESGTSKGILEAPARGTASDGGGYVEWLTKTFNESEIDILSKSIENDIHKSTYVPNMNDENFMGNVSGEAMKYKLFGLLQLLVTKERYLVSGIRRRLKLLQNIMLIKSEQVDVDGADIHIIPNIPVNMTDVINNIKNADGFVPQPVTLSWLTNTTYSTADMIKMLDSEAEKKAKRAADAMGTMTTSNFDREGGNDNDSSSISSSNGSSKSD
ncbi:phage portal protein [Lapidilactobacillus achengensis]|uniref:Phage portal protein n=1 Tax=Lapidilactobacillus achengensis TaxID=2486000 RepID=A0ABW1UPE8_9LACO|nr:phage portal protein [Lapidilactobacillus achengensis]